MTPSRNLAVHQRAGCFLGVFLLPVLMAGLGLIGAGGATAQTFTTLHSFTAGSGGGFPYAGLVLSGNTLYGTAGSGGSSGGGTVFKVNRDGSGFTNLHSFTPGSDGHEPWAGLILSDNTLYGTTVGGASTYLGTVFAVNTDGTGFTNLHSFTAASGSADYPPDGTNSDGAYPFAGLTLSGNTLYGAASVGGSSGNGTVFAVNTDGSGFTNLHSFAGGNDGDYPWAGLILSSNTLYGTTSGNAFGYSSGPATVFAINTDGSGFTNLHSFTDGSQPSAGLVLSGNTLYGTAAYGGSSGNGTVFAVNTDGTGFTNLHSFTGGSDGHNPRAGLILSGNTLYGTAWGGGSSGGGTAFALNIDGSGFTTLHSFTGSIAHPDAGLILSDNTLYGTTPGSITADYYGAIFSISFTPQLTITPSGANVVLTWPTNVAGFDYTGYNLQSTTNLGSSVWNAVSPAPVVVNGQNAVTNPISGTQQFFRLSQ